MSKSFTTEEFIEKVKQIHLNKYDYSKVKYVNSKKKVEIVCPIHGLFSQLAGDHLRGRGCKECSFEARRMSEKEFIEKSNIIHNNKYDYSIIKYIDRESKIEIICPIHGSFWQLPNTHLFGSYGSGSGCQICANNIPNIDDFIRKANLSHCHKYNYLNVHYINSRTKIEIICPIHGSFWQTPSNHVYGCGCRRCMIDSYCLTIKEFIEKSNIIHNNKYDYSLVKYINSLSKIKIICPVHGIFKQIAGTHLAGHGCKKCSTNVSKKSQEWLDQLNIKQENREKFIRMGNRKLTVDGFDPETNTVYEFYGDFWHGNPEIYNRDHLNNVNNKTFGELYNNTIEREVIIKTNGYRLITIWEMDFIK